MSYSSTAYVPVPLRSAARGRTSRIAGYVYFTFICYVSIGLPLAVLPPFVHLRMGYSALLAGLAISIQYIATLLSRPWAGHISDHMGAKVSVMWGMAGCTVSGALLVGAAVLHEVHWLSFTVLILSRLVLGVGESLGSTGSTIWGINSAGHEHTAKVIGLNGISTYGGMALAAPLGVVLEQQWGLSSIGILTILIGAVSFVLAWRKAPVIVEPGEHMPFTAVLGRVASDGMGLALGGVGYGTLATFVTLFYVSRHWSGAALCLTAFGIAFIAVRLLFIKTISRWGGYPVAIVSLATEAVGMVLLWQARFAVDGNGRRGSRRVGPVAGVPGDRRRSSEAGSGVQSRDRSGRLYRVLRRVVLSGWTNCRRDYRILWLRERVPVCADQRDRGAGNRDGAEKRSE